MFTEFEFGMDVTDFDQVSNGLGKRLSLMAGVVRMYNLIQYTTYGTQLIKDKKSGTYVKMVNDDIERDFNMSGWCMV